MGDFRLDDALDLSLSGHPGKETERRQVNRPVLIHLTSKEASSRRPRHLLRRRRTVVTRVEERLGRSDHPVGSDRGTFQVRRDAVGYLPRLHDGTERHADAFIRRFDQAG